MFLFLFLFLFLFHFFIYFSFFHLLYFLVHTLGTMHYFKLGGVRFFIFKKKKSMFSFSCDMQVKKKSSKKLAHVQFNQTFILENKRGVTVF